IEKVGRTLATGCGLRGLFGVDGVLRDGYFLPVEVNPRYTASVEVLEHATGVAALDLHRLSSLGRKLSPVEQRPAAGMIGKAILYAREELTLPEGPWTETARAPDPLRLPEYADVPDAGERIEAGRPVLTLFARGDTPEACVAELR